MSPCRSAGHEGSIDGLFTCQYRYMENEAVKPTQVEVLRLGVMGVGTYV